MSFFSDWTSKYPSPGGLADAPPKTKKAPAGGMSQEEFEAALAEYEAMFSGGGYGGGGGGGSYYQPQTAEEAALLGAQTGWLGAQTAGMPGLWGAQAGLYGAQAAGLPERTAAETALYGAQAADIPLAREQSRRQMLAEIGVAQAERAANPRRIFEALYAQARLKPTEMAKGLQEKMNIPGFKEGKTVEGPALARVGKNDDEYALLAPGSVVAPKPTGETPTVGNALSAILYQMREGGVVSQPKAKKMLKHGEVRGKALTEGQKGLFGLIAGGGKPMRLHKAQGGLDVSSRRFRDDRLSGATLPSGARPARPANLQLDKRREDRRHLFGAPGQGESYGWGEEYGLPQGVSDEFEGLRQQATETVLGAMRPATAGTSLFDPMGGGRFTPEQAQYLRGLNIRDFGKLSPTQQQGIFSMLSAGGVEPADYEESLKRHFRGFNPVAAGTQTRFAGMLGR